MTNIQNTFARPAGSRKRSICAGIDHAVLGSFIASAVFLAIQIARGNAGTAGTATTAERNYTLMLLQCTAGIAAIHIPALLGRFLRLQVPAALRVMFSLFLFCAIFLGEVGNFYYLVPHWDDVLHFGSGAMLCLLGFMLASVMNRGGSLSPVFVAVFGVCFALAVGGLWEVYEYTFDGLLGLNMQKTALASGEALAGHAAIADTMKDLLVDAAGATAGAVPGCRALRNGKGWIRGAQRETPRENPKPPVPFGSGKSRAA